MNIEYHHKILSECHARYKKELASRDAEIAELKAELETERCLSFRNQVAELEAERDQLHNELEIERMRNVSCGVVAMADTPDSAKQARDMHPDYMSASCSDVARRVDECIKLRAQVKMLMDAATRAHRKLSAYVGVCTGDKELTNTIIPMLKEALAATEQK